MRALALFIILIGNMAGAVVKDASPLLPPSRAGYYRLLQGTDGCPKEVTWRFQPSCHGFDIIETESGLSTPHSIHHMFCNVNRAPLTAEYRISSWEKYRVRSVVKTGDNHIHKKQVKEGTINQAQFRVETEETLVFDQYAFVFDKSVGGKGWSCLYRKF